MASKAQVSDLSIHPFSCAHDFESFLDRCHSSSPGIYLKLAKKASRIQSITFDEATDVALCFGWINGQGKAFDDQWSLSRFVPRRPNSTWSQRNVGKVEMLTEAGRMRPAGLAAVQAAKADGRWGRAYATPTTIEVPDDLELRLAENEEARNAFKALNKTARYNALVRIEWGSRKTRASRLDALVSALADGKTKRDTALTAHGVKKARVAGKGQTKKSTQAAPKTVRQVKKASTLHDEGAEAPRRSGLRPRR
ncbi:MAG: hypothetical protein M1828_004167 [Chrysothrix sp. TS-e1954]|nr:MAG: hypothetical protein M1828_004167 [Chrysothrix sp. TS-e1954]